MINKWTLPVDQNYTIFSTSLLFGGDEINTLLIRVGSKLQYVLKLKWKM